MVTTEGIELRCPSLTEGSLQCLILEDTPDVMSVGQRCSEYGYGFYWAPWAEEPYLHTPDGRVLQLTVSN